MISAGVSRIRHGGSEESINAVWRQSFLIEVPGPSHSVPKGKCQVVQRQVSKQTPKGRRWTEKCDSEAKQQTPLRNNLLRLFCVKLLQLSTTPTLNRSKPFSFTRRDTLRPTPPIQLGLPTPPIHPKHSPTFTPIIACRRLGDYEEQPDSWMSLPDLKNPRRRLC